MTEAEKWELINSCKTSEELSEAILKVANPNGEIVGSRQIPWNVEQQASFVPEVINGSRPVKTLTGSYGIRRQAINIARFDTPIGVKELTPDEYQRACAHTAIYPNIGRNPYYTALGLGEAGEVQNLVKKLQRDSNGIITKELREKVGKELGDLMWYVAMTAFEFRLSLSVIMEGNIQKLNSRKDRGVLSGNGDDR